MLVVEVWTLVEPLAFRTSAGSPESVSTIAAIEFQVRCATWVSGRASAEAPAGKRSIAANTAMNVARMACREIPGRFGSEPRAFRHVSVRGQALRRFHPRGRLPWAGQVDARPQSRRYWCCCAQ